MDSPSRQQILEWAAEFKAGSITREDKLRFQSWLRASPPDEVEWLGPEDRETLKAEMYAAIVTSIRSTRPQKQWIRYAAAAAVLVAIAGLAYFYDNAGRTKQEQLEIISADASPASQGAILVLEDGKRLKLDSLKEGKITSSGGNSIEVSEGSVSYAAGLSGQSGTNTLITPKGRYYQLTMSDGTRVWMNAASSISYPASFAADNRKVSVRGEVYFEVAKDKSRPFIVEAGDQQVKVLGTHFNVNAYEDEPEVVTTLLEGSVKVTRGMETLQLLPQEACSFREGKLRSRPANLEEVSAWRQGLFYFNNADLPTVMRQLERWYDVRVIWEGKVPTDKFIGKIPRDARASEVLKALESMQVHFRIENNSIIVQP